MADILEADYEILEQVSRRFAQQSEEIQQTMQNLRNHMGQLQNSWQGHGSDAFLAEMQDEILPAVDRLRKAFEEAGFVTGQIIETLSQAEEEAGNSFRVVG